MGTATLSKEEKERLLRAVEEDREFRYALMGLLGMRELLERFTRIEERQQRLEERFAQLEERFAGLEEKQQKLEERFAKLEERQQRLEERFAELEERFARLEERFAKLEERQQELEGRLARLKERFAQLEERFIKLEERQQRLEEEFIKLGKRQQELEDMMYRVFDKVIELSEGLERVRRRQELMAMEIGALTESTYCRFLWEDLRWEIESSGDRVVMRRRSARVDGEDIDLLVETSRRVYVVEVKVRPKASDVGKLIAKAEIVGRRYAGKEVIPILAGAMIGEDVETYAAKKGVKVFAY